MPDTPQDSAEPTGGRQLISFADMPAHLEAAGLKRVSAQRCRQLAEEDPNWPIPLREAPKVGRVRLFDWAVLEPYFKGRQSRQGQRTDRMKPKPPAKEPGVSYDQKRLLITARVSRRNDERDHADDQLFDGLRERIRQILAEPQYENIEPDVSDY